MTELDDFDGDDLLDADGNVVPCTTPMLGTCDTHCQHWYDGTGPCCWCSAEDAGDEDEPTTCPALVDEEDA